VNSSDIRFIQQKLGIDADGIMGPQTRNAIIEYQKSHGLDPDGVVGPKTMASLRGNATPTGGGGFNSDREQKAIQYGITTNMLNAFPELKNLFNDAVSGGWTTDKFQAMFRNTDFWKSRSDQQRKVAIQMYTDPATYGQLWNTTQSHIRQLMADMGSDPNNWDWINQVAGKVIFDGWSDEQARNQIGQYIVFDDHQNAGGKAGVTQQNLNSYAYSMGVQNSNYWMANAVRSVMTGSKSEQDYKNEIMSQAIAAFPQYEKQLRAGSTLQDLAQPYMQSMSQILEIAPGTVNMFDPTIRKAMSTKDASGQQAAQPLWDFQNTLRQDPRWAKTQNAQDTAMGTAHKVLQDFGVVY
jgi:Putative peptidoglycan binding domain